LHVITQEIKYRFKLSKKQKSLTKWRSRYLFLFWCRKEKN